jgi:uncharacterized membrane protein
MLILDLGVLGIAWFKRWPWLNYLAYVGTAMLFLGAMQGEPTGRVFLFLTLFFLTYLATSVIHHFARKEPSGTNDLGFLTVNAAGYFLVAYSVLEPAYEDFLGFFALLLSVLYLSVAYVAFTAGTRDRMLTLSLAGIATIFLSVAIPLQFDGHWVSLSWLIESLVLLTIGIMLRESFVKWFGWGVFVLGMISVIEDVMKIRYGYGWNGSFGTANLLDVYPFGNWAFWMIMIAVASFAAVAVLYRKYRVGDSWKSVVMAMALFANLVFLAGVTTEIDLSYDRRIVAIKSAEGMTDSMLRYSYGTTWTDPYTQEYRSLSPSALDRISAAKEENRTVRLIFWTVFAVFLIVLGFMRRLSVLRVGGLILIFFSAAQGFFIVWGLGPVYKIYASIGFGILALGASYLYVRYRNVLKSIITDEHA